MPPEFKGVRDTDPPLRRSGGPAAEGRPADDSGLRARSLTESDDVYSEYHARRKDGGSSSFGLIAGVVIGLSAVGGIGWYMWSSGSLSPGAASNGAPQVVKADPDPYKIKPENPGGMQVENQDKLVYDRVAKGEAPPRVENLLPGPEEPKAPPKPAAPEVVPEASKPEAPPAETAKTETLTAEPAKPAPEVSKPEAAKAEPAKELAKVEPAKPEPAKAEAAKPAEPDEDDLAAAVLAATGGREAATGPIAAAPSKPAASPSTPAPAAPAEPPVQVAAAPVAVPPAAMAGSFQIQLASARSEQGAMAEWNRIVGKNKDALAGLTPNVARVDLGDKGVFFRLRAGPLADRAAADALCGTLGAQNVGCIVVRP